ncbi:MAG: hypothetical protein M3Z65_00990 [Chloroflexota bacterium]|nr:hypothetical protein [Chloroflexota bacterium]
MREIRANWMTIVGWSLLAFGIGYIDWASGPFFSMTLFYLVPVAGAAWSAGRSAGTLVALAAGAASLTSDVLLLHQASNVPLFWNTGSRTFLLVIAAVAIDLIRRDRDRLSLLDAQRARSLQLLDRGLAAPAREMAELVDQWDGSLEGLKTMLRPRADEIGFLARDFSTMVRLQSGELPLSTTTFDLTDLVDELRAEHMGPRTIGLVRPTGSLRVAGDRARTRQALSALFALPGFDADLLVSLRSHQGAAEVVLSSTDRANARPAIATNDEAGLTVQLAQMLFTAQGGSVEVARNRLTHTSRATARLPLAT